MSMLRSAILLLGCAFALGAWAERAPAPVPVTADLAANSDTLRSYRRLLPLEGGSNFRDLGGYPTEDGRTVKRGLLFRSGAMTGLTEADAVYLEQFGFQAVVDLRSTEELDLYPNRWARGAGVNYLHHPYSMLNLMRDQGAEIGSAQGDYSPMYRYMQVFLKPQLSLYFDTLLAGKVPAVVNCSAGQDRTGVTSALLLTALGVERELVIEDYLLSTDFRRPGVERGDVDLEEAAETNAFAAMMLQHGGGTRDERPNSLVTPQGVPFITFTLDAIEQSHGSVAAYLEQELGVDATALERLRGLYLEG